MPVPESTLHFVGFLAIVTSGASFLNFDKPTRVLFALFGALIWFVFGFFALDVCPSQQCGDVAMELDALMFVGYGAGLVMAMLFVKYAFELVKENNEPMR